MLKSNSGWTDCVPPDASTFKRGRNHQIDAREVWRSTALRVLRQRMAVQQPVTRRVAAGSNGRRPEVGHLADFRCGAAARTTVVESR